MKRVIFILFAVMFGGTLTAQNQFTIGDLTYEVLNGGNSVEVHDCDTSATSVDIPSTVTNNGTKYSVTSIRYTAFYECRTLTSITIPNSITTIETMTFYGCSSLTSVNIPNSVISIGDYAFSKCSSLTSVNIPNSVISIGESAFSYCSSLTSVTIPNSVISIGESAFSYCSSLTSVTIPNSVTYIGDGTFYNCSSLTSVTIPNSVTSIKYSAFSGCSSLTSVTIPNSVKSIRDWAFSGCSNLTAINVDSGNTHYSSIDGVLYNHAQDTLIQCPEAKSSVNIPKSVTYIRNEAFSGCSNLTSITIPNSVKSIGDWAFSGCSNLTAINVDSGNTHYSSIDGVLYNYAQDTLIQCPKIKSSITIPNSVTYIRNEAFSGCSNLTSVSIPNSVKSIGERAFSDCSNLTAINVDSDNTHYSSINGILYNYAQDTLIQCPGAKSSVNIPNKVTTIGYGAFSHCNNLTAITIPNNIKSIGENAFSNCDNLTAITIPNSVKSIGERAFSNCSNLTAINVDSGNTHYSSIDGILYNHAQDTLIQCPGAKSSVNIPNKVTTIGYGAFCNCNNLTAITIPNSITSIEENAFEGCSNLTSVLSLAYTPPILGVKCFDGVNSDCSFIVPCKSMTAYHASNWIYWINTDNITGSYYTEISATINKGEIYTEYGFNENKTGTYTRTVENQGDCDSTIVLHLSVNASL